MFDAILLASYGGPESIAEIEPFLDAILDGKRVPPARRAMIVERYRRFNGKSPLPQECRNFIDRLQNELQTANVQIKTYWGNLFTPPTFHDAFEQMEQDGIGNVLVITTSAFGSPQSCQRYRTAVRAALESRSKKFIDSCRLSFVPPFFDLPSFSRTIADNILTELAWDSLNSDDLFATSNSVSVQIGKPTRLVLFTAHSIPTADGVCSSYKRQLLETAYASLETLLNAPGFGGPTKQDRDRLDESLGRFPQRNPFSEQFDKEEKLPDVVRARLRMHSLDAALAFQSRSGSPATPWLSPSVDDFIRKYKQEEPQLESVVVSPIGFFFDNMETIYDLDVELRGVCADLGLKYRRTSCCGASERIVKTVVKLALLPNEAFPMCQLGRRFCDFSCRLIKNDDEIK